MSPGALWRVAGRILLTTVLMTAATWHVSLAWPADVEIVILPGALEPSRLRIVAGRRVEFVNRANAAVHVEFAGDGREHKMVQVPAAGPTWVIFYRPGTHPYVVHLYGPGAATLRGLVDVIEDSREPRTGTTSGTVVLGECIEPCHDERERGTVVGPRQPQPLVHRASVCRSRSISA
jgi:plastocyanin